MHVTLMCSQSLVLFAQQLFHDCGSLPFQKGVSLHKKSAQIIVISKGCWCHLHILATLARWQVPAVYIGHAFPSVSGHRHTSCNLQVRIRSLRSLRTLGMTLTW